jgi:predicted dehydrogenase
VSDLGFGLVGCGRIAKKYGEILAGGHVSGARLAAVCDCVPERARRFGEHYGVPWFGDSHEMMERTDDIDVVSVLTPSGYHAENTIELASYGRHMVVEKPMALTVDSADAMIEACDRAGVRLFVVKQNRYNRAVVRTREALEAGRFGRLVMGTVRVRWCRTQAYYDQDPWRGTWALDGGVFANQASHHVDLLEWMLGEPESVFAKSITALVDIEVEDTGIAVLRFTNGALGLIEATNATRPQDLEGSLSLLGEKGSVVVGGFAVNEIVTWKFADHRPEDDTVHAECNEEPPDVYGFGHIPYLEHVVSCIRSDTPALVDGLEGRRSLELISAIYESIETGREVRLRFRPDRCKLGLKGR